MVGDDLVFHGIRYRNFHQAIAVQIDGGRITRG